MNSCHVCRRICDRPVVTCNADSRVGDWWQPCADDGAAHHFL